MITHRRSKVKQTKIRKKESAGVNAVLRINEAIDLHDRVVVEGYILAQANMARCARRKNANGGVCETRFCLPIPRYSDAETDNICVQRKSAR